MHGFPFSCVSIALVVDRRPVVGVVHNPILGETYTAVRGRGAFLNGARCACSGESMLNRALMATEIGTTRDEETVAAVTARLRVLVEHARSVRACGAAAMNLAGVASGRLDGFFEVGFGGASTPGVRTGRRDPRHRRVLTPVSRARALVRDRRLLGCRGRRAPGHGGWRGGHGHLRLRSGRRRGVRSHEQARAGRGDAGAREPARGAPGGHAAERARALMEPSSARTAALVAMAPAQ